MTLLELDFKQMDNEEVKHKGLSIMISFQGGNMEISDYFQGVFAVTMVGKESKRMQTQESDSIFYFFSKKVHVRCSYFKKSLMLKLSAYPIRANTTPLLIRTPS